VRLADTLGVHTAQDVLTDLDDVLHNAVDQPWVVRHQGLECIALDAAHLGFADRAQGRSVGAAADEAHLARQIAGAQDMDGGELPLSQIASDRDSPLDDDVQAVVAVALRDECLLVVDPAAIGDPGQHSDLLVGQAIGQGRPSQIREVGLGIHGGYPRSCGWRASRRRGFTAEK
jgi:hypothetical protein